MSEPVPSFLWLAFVQMSYLPLLSSFEKTQKQCHGDLSQHDDHGVSFLRLTFVLFLVCIYFHDVRLLQAHGRLKDENASQSLAAAAAALVSRTTFLTAAAIFVEKRKRAICSTYGAHFSPWMIYETRPKAVQVVYFWFQIEPGWSHYISCFVHEHMESRGSQTKYSHGF